MKYILVSLSYAITLCVIAMAIVISFAPQAVAHPKESQSSSIDAPPKSGSRASAPIYAPKSTYKPASKAFKTPIGGPSNKTPDTPPRVLAVAPKKSANCQEIPCRRTLYVTVDQKKIALEAPMGMCFLDQTSKQQGLLHKAFSEVVEKKGRQSLLAAFMNCEDAINSANWSESEEALPNFGFITWKNPPTTSMSRQDYLDMREASFLQYATENAEGLLIDTNVRRTANGVFIGMSGTTGTSNLQLKTTNMLATSMLRDIPIEVTLRYNGASPPTLDAVYSLIDKFIEQQVTLNP